MNQQIRVPDLARHIKHLIAPMVLEDIVGEVRSPGHPDRIGNYQYTGNGRIFFSCDPRADEVFIDDIALHLSRIPRFGGANINFLSVAEHSWLCSYAVPEEVALEALLHDAAEAYIGDLIRPLKRLPIFGDIYLKIEGPIEKAVAERFKLTYPWPDEVKRADELVVGAEVAQNIRSKVVNHLSDDIAARTEGERSATQLYYWNADLAKIYFLQRFTELAAKRGLVIE